MTDFTLPHGDLLIAPDHRDWVESLVSQMSDSKFASTFTQKVNDGEEMRSPGDDEFWIEGFSLRPYNVAHGTLTIPVKGMLMKSFPYAMGGMATGYEYIQAAIERGVGDPEVHTIKLDINSPGGMVAGCFDCADAIHAARGRKPINAFANEAAYSAAYAIASAADTLTVARTGGVGSIGVITMHMERSAMIERMGVKVTPIFAGEQKADGNQFAPLPDDVKARMQERVDALYEIFVSTVARNRSMDEQAVRDTEAATFMPLEAVENGLADAVGGLGLMSANADLSNDEDEEMSKEITSVELADHEAAVATATAAGTEAGIAEGANLERARISAILGSDEATAHRAAASHVALNTDMTAEAAASFLAALPDETVAAAPQGKSAFEIAMANGEQPNLGASLEGNDDDKTTAKHDDVLATVQGLGLVGFKSA